LIVIPFDFLELANCSKEETKIRERLHNETREGGDKEGEGGNSRK
jgi:hypothetical protein